VRISAGVPHPLGATWDGAGTNFALFSANATKVELCLFDSQGRRELERIALADHPQEKTISLLAISVSHLHNQVEMQLDLPLGLPDEHRRPGTRRGIARWTADKAVDKIRERFGWQAVGYGSAMFETSRSVPDGFRELAEKEL
jgi:pullulanase/glycogen debranching enzyme